MGYKKYSDEAAAWRIIEKIQDGELTGNTAYRELISIRNEWKGTQAGDAAERLLDEMFSDY